MSASSVAEGSRKRARENDLEEGKSARRKFSEIDRRVEGLSADILG